MDATTCLRVNSFNFRWKYRSKCYTRRPGLQWEALLLPPDDRLFRLLPDAVDTLDKLSRGEPLNRLRRVRGREHVSPLV